MNEPSYNVVWPLGRSAIEMVTANARVSNLDERRIALIWDHLFRGDELLEILKENILRDYPKARFVDHAAFGNIHGPHEAAVIGALPGLLRQHKIDAAIVAVGA